MSKISAVHFRRSAILVVTVLACLGVYGLLDWFIASGQVPSNFTSISAGPAQTCAIQDTGDLYCWGVIWSGEFNEEQPGSLSIRPATRMDILGEVLDVANGENHTCAMLKYDGIQCWGMNGYGQLGIEGRRWTSTPTSVVDLLNMPTEIAAGRHYTCALLNDGVVQCWGDNLHGQVGLYPTGNRVFSPIRVENLDNEAIAIAAGESHTCALLKAGNVQCWGRNARGQIGDGTTEDRSSPSILLELERDAVSIAANGGHTCALLSNGEVQCWGSNSNGQLGDGTTQNRLHPTMVVNLASNVTSIAAGVTHTCALLDDDRVQCWGDNQFGQLGDGSTSNRLEPKIVSNFGGSVIDIAAGTGHTCALLDDGRVQCWGYNRGGQLGGGIDTWRNAREPKEIRGAGLRFWNYW